MNAVVNHTASPRVYKAPGTNSINTNATLESQKTPSHLPSPTNPTYHQIPKSLYVSPELTGTIHQHALDLVPMLLPQPRQPPVRRVRPHAMRALPLRLNPTRQAFFFAVFAAPVWRRMRRTKEETQ